MKTLLTLILCLTLCAGCSTTRPVNQVRVEQGAAVFKGTVRSLVFYAIQKDKNSKAYFQAAQAAISIVVDVGNYSPGSLQQALNQTSVKELKSVEAQIAMNALLSVYEVYYAGRLESKIAENPYLLAFLTAARDGMALGISDSQ